MEIFKFGGSTLKDAASIQHFGKIMNSYSNHTIVLVISAFGKVTKMLEGVFEKKINHISADKEVQEIYKYHLDMLHDLFEEPQPKLIKELDLFKASLATLSACAAEKEDEAKLYSKIVSWGEMLSSKIISAYLIHIRIPCLWVDASLYIKTQHFAMNAMVDEELTRDCIMLRLKPLLSENKIVVMQGFIGSDSLSSYTTTLGKEGSDYTAALLAAGLQAKTLTVWKDVPGVMNGDPQIFDDVERIKEISYQNMFTMAFYGAQVIHPKTIYPLISNNIPLHIKSFRNEDEPHTVVSDYEKDTLSVPVYILRRKQVWLKIKPRDRVNMDSTLSNKILKSLRRRDVEMNFLDLHAEYINLCFTDDYISPKYLLPDLMIDFEVEYKFDVSLLTIINYKKAPASLPILENATIVAQKRFKNIEQKLFL